MGKTKKTKTPVDERSLEILRHKLKKSNKIVTKDGTVKKKILKQFTVYQCDVCKKNFTDKYNLTNHEKLHLDEEYPCTECRYVGKTKKYLARHIRIKHTVPRNACSVCGQAFHHPSGLKEHFMVHTGEKPLKCEVCGKTFRVSYSLNSHMLIHKDEKPYKCSFCPYACRDNSTLRKHEFRHMGIIKTFPCRICRKKFDSKPKLKYHVSEVHLDYLELDLKRHACEQCGRSFKLKANMVKHVEIVHVTSPPCVCPLCNRRLKHKQYLPRHLRTHFPERPHVCTHAGCKKAFKDKGDLRKHSIIHGPRRHLSCTRCGATFTRAHRLAAHERTHEPREKNVTCHYCHVKFYTKNYLIKHIKQKHSDEKQRYICDHCGLVTFNKPSIVMHLKYGRCRSEDLRCKICKTTYKHLTYLRSHYLKTHKMRYKPMKHRKKKERKPTIEVKVEPMDDPYEDVQLSLLEVSKEEIEVEEEGNMENDLISYSKRVLSEDLQYLLEDPREDKTENDFDEFLLKHVFHKKAKDEEEPEPQIEKTDERQEAIVVQKIKDVIRKAKDTEERKKRERDKKRQAKILEKKLKREAKMVRRKKRREKFDLERVRQMYNDRMKRAAAEALKKEPAKKIKYFQPKSQNERNTAKGMENNNNSNHKESSVDVDSFQDKNNRNKGLDLNEDDPKNAISNASENENSPIDKNNENNENSTNELKDLNVNNELKNTGDSESDNTKIGNVENELNETVKMNDENIGENEWNETSDRQNFTNDEKNCININDKVNGINDIACDVNDEDNGINDKTCGKNDENDDSNDEACVVSDEANGTNHENNDTNDKQNCDNGIDKGLHNLNNGAIEDITNDNEKDSTLNDKDDDDDNDDSNDDKADRDSNYEPNSEDEPTPSKKMKFSTFQCYICFKLYPTKEELISHCEIHFDVCNSTTLSKCPACGHVVSRNMAKHMRVKHGMHVTIPYSRISRNDDGEGSKYCYKLADTVMEIIPSVKMLNHSAAIQIDRRNRERRDKTLLGTRLVKKGTEWVVEKFAVDVSYQEMPEFTEKELKSLPVSENYAERLGGLGRLARGRGVRILYPCGDCDKICQNLAALKLHYRRHDPDKKPFAARRVRGAAGGVVGGRTTAEGGTKVKSLENRVAKPQPIKNKHKCDEKLKKFYETHIRGADIEFWQFLKIYNKMDRENIKDFPDLECRTDFGMHKFVDSSKDTETGNTSSIIEQESGNTLSESDLKSGNILSESDQESGNTKTVAKCVKSKTSQQSATLNSKEKLNVKQKKLATEQKKTKSSQNIVI